MSSENIKNFYNSTGMEKDRLEQHVFNLEKIRTQEIIERYLQPNMTIADIGGATGAYAFWLHDLGHQVHLLDATELHIETAGRISKEENKKLASITLGDARSLPFNDELFDLVLLFGPLYHLQKKEDRINVLCEAKRVLKKGGTLLAATITRYASLFDGFWLNLVEDPAFEKILDGDLKDGNHHNHTNNPVYFTESHFHTQKEITEEFTEAGFMNLSVEAIEGFGWLVPGFSTQWNDAVKRERMLNYIRQTAVDPIMTGISAHVMTIVKKEGPL